MGVYRNYITEENDMQTMLFRYAVVLDILDWKLPKNLKCEQRISDSLKNKILTEPYSEQNDRLLILFGMGIIDEATLENLVLFNKSDWLNDVITLENRVRSDEEMELESDRKKLSDIFAVCANSRKFEEMNGVDFGTAEKMLDSAHTAAVDGFIHTSKEIMSFMQIAGAEFGFYDSDDDTIHIESPNVISQIAASDDFDIFSERTPFPLDYVVLQCCLSIFGKVYDMDFLRYVIEQGIPFDDSFSNEYEKYISDVKLKFEIKAYLKKRKICGSRLNVFDYSTQTIEGGIMTGSELVPDKGYSTEIHLESEEAFTDEMLLERALKKYTSSWQPEENMIIDVSHYQSTYRYIYREGKLDKFTDYESETFNTELFDFNEIWSLITECSESGKLRRKGDTIIIPSEFTEKIRPEWREYADRIVSDQYGRRKRNMIAATLNELKQAAQQVAQKAVQRKSSATILNNDTGGN